MMVPLDCIELSLTRRRPITLRQINPASFCVDEIINEFALTRLRATYLPGPGNSAALRRRNYQAVVGIYPRQVIDD